MTAFDFASMIPITKGWSEDKKYCLTKADGTKYLLRITPIARYEARKSLFGLLKQLEKLDICMCKPIEFGTCEEGVYALHSWIEGSDAEEVIPLLPDTEQYLYGVKAGEMLKRIHTVPAPIAQENWETRFGHKIDNKIKAYGDCPLKYANGEKWIATINSNRHLLRDRPQCFQHGDYHINNMMLENRELTIIDFDRFDFGDPWEEFNRIVWCVEKSPLFASGMVNGYFDGEPPNEFWKLLALYVACNMLSALYWAIPFGQSEVDVMQKQALDVQGWYEGTQTPIPKWYFKGYYVQYTDGIPYKMKAPFDFGFLKQYGNVFKVFDDQDSGNICFGVHKKDTRYFVKFAGSPTEQYTGTAQDAISRLKTTLSVYQHLSHPNLIKYIRAQEIGGGFAVLFEWADGECMGKAYPWSHRKFMQMPLKTKLSIYADLLDFHAYVAKQGYVAIDFYDGSVMYDVDKCKTTVCDIDFYTKTPYTNDMGRMWGSSRFMSPEEYTPGAMIDEITNVYTMGATAFAMFADCKRDLQNWPLSKEKYEIALKAVQDNRCARQQSIKQFMDEWHTVVLIDEYLSFRDTAE